MPIIQTTMSDESGAMQNSETFEQWCRRVHQGEIVRLSAEIDRLRELLREARPAVESYIRKHSRALSAAMRRKDEFHIDRHETIHALSVRLLDRIDAAIKEAPSHE